jgi:hypothetical protein
MKNSYKHIDIINKKIRKVYYSCRVSKTRENNSEKYGEFVQFLVEMTEMRKKFILYWKK